MSGEARVHELTTKVDGETYTICVRRPSRAEYKRYLADVGRAENHQQRSELLENLLLAHLESKKDDFEQIAEERPGLVETFGGKLLELLGLGAEVDAKKL